MQRKASSAIEYITLIVFILAALSVFQHYIFKGLSGRWKTVGDIFGHGKQYDARDFGAGGTGGGTRECFYDNGSNKWVDTRCFKEDCFSSGGDCYNKVDLSEPLCEACVATCNEDRPAYAQCGGE